MFNKRSVDVRQGHQITPIVVINKTKSCTCKLMIVLLFEKLNGSVGRWENETFYWDGQSFVK